VRNFYNIVSIFHLVEAGQEEKEEGEGPQKNFNSGR
jgi:hypothetical protein